MRHAIAIAARDLRERTNIFVVAAIAAAAPFVVTLVRRPAERPSLLLVVGLVGSAAMTLGVAIAVGLTMVTSDLADRHMSFYFSKPLSAPAIWFGKLGAALVTVALTFAIVFVPAYLAGNGAWHATVPGGPFDVLRWIFVASILFVLGSHAIATILRSRSLVSIVDVTLATGAVFVLGWMARPLIASFATLLCKVLGMFLLFSIPVVIAIAGALQLARGRTDIRASHREFSRAFWSAIAVVIGAVGLYTVYVLSASPTDLQNLSVSASPRGDFIAVGGRAKRRGDFEPLFLIGANGWFTREGSRRTGSIEFTRNGSAAMTLSPVVEGFSIAPKLQFSLLPLDGSSRRIDPGITTSYPAPVALVASDDLRRLVTFDTSLVSVYDIASRTLLGSARVPNGDEVRMFFVTPDLVRIYAVVPRWRKTPLKASDLWIYEFDVRTRQLHETGRVPSVPYIAAATTSSDGATLLITTNETRILDGRTGAQRAAVSATGRPAFLSDGRIAVVQGAFIRILDPSGTLVREIAIRRPVGAGYVRELVPGRKLLLVARDAGNSRQATAAVVDVETGRIENALSGVALVTQTWAFDPRPPVYGVETVIMDRAGALWRWNPLTGAKTRLL